MSFLKQKIALGFLVFFLVVPTTYASYEEQQKTLLLQLIHLLQQKLAMLQLQVGQNYADVPSPVQTEVLSQKNLVSSKFYSGPYLAIYQTDGYILSSVTGSSMVDLDAEIWDVFVDVASVDFISENISEFRIYSDIENQYGAFVDSIGLENKWILAVNVEGLNLANNSDREYMRNLLIHEFAHMIFAQNPDILFDFIKKFWTTEDINFSKNLDSLKDSSERDILIGEYYKEHSRDFVSEYAVISPSEDLSESFVRFVMMSQENKYGKQAQKITFFGEYNFLIELQSEMRTRLKDF